MPDAVAREAVADRADLTDPHPRIVEPAARLRDNGDMNATTSLPSGSPAPRCKPCAKRLPIEVVDELRRRIRLGQESIAAAARRLGRSENSIRRAIRSFDRTSGSHSYKDATEPDVPARATGRPPRVSPETVRAILAEKGKRSGAAVARDHGVTGSYVSRLWKGLNRLDVADAVEASEAVQ